MKPLKLTLTLDGLNSIQIKFLPQTQHENRTGFRPCNLTLILSTKLPSA